MGNTSSQVFRQIASGNEEEALSLLQSTHNANLLSPSGTSVMRASLDRGQLKLFKYCYQRNAVLIPPLEKGRSILHKAIELGHYDFTWKLLRDHKTFKQNPNEQDSDGRTALHLAVEACNSDLVALLLKYNAKKDLQDKSGRSAFDLALSIKRNEGQGILEQFSMEDCLKKSVSESHPAKDQISTQVSKGPDSEKTAKISMLEKTLEETQAPVIRGEDLEILELINKGSSCLVYKGKWRGKEVAVKQFTTEYSESEKKMKKFAKELQVLTRVDHPNLLRLMGICIERPNLCLITELVPNFTLFYAIHKNKDHKLTMTERFSIAVQLCRGVAYLHNNNPPIIHRDLKPENCLMDHALNVKIADFGLARFSSSFTQGEESMTTICIGTTRFMAPELFDNSACDSIGIEVDIWALGCLIIEVFSNKRPWHYISSSKANSIFFEIFNKKPIPIPENVDGKIAEVIRSCCSYSPKLRPSAQKVLERIEEVRDSMFTLEDC
jgi:tRNA A-37 threonylcarbamoyl transferase component Bud32